MTKKSVNLLEDPPTASSSDDDVETSGEGEKGSSSEEEEPKNPVRARTAAVTISVPGKTTVAAAAKKASASDSGSEIDTDSDSETERASNPMNPGSGKAVSLIFPASKPSTVSALPAMKTGTKRPSEGTSSNAKVKRVKKISSGDDEKKIGEDTKKPSFKRLWSEEDEIVLLQGIIDFKNDTGKSPFEQTNVYYDCIKNSISFDVSKNQFVDKIKSLKKKYMGKGKKTFTKPHDQKSFKLSQYIWGPEGMALESAVKSNGVSKKSQKTKTDDSVKQELKFTSPSGKKVEEDDNKVLTRGEGDLESSVDVKNSDWFENSFLMRSISGLGVDEHYVKHRWSFVPVENKKKIEERVKKVQAMEFELGLEKMDILHEVRSKLAENKTM